MAPYGIVLVVDRLAAWMLLTTSLLAVFALLYAVRGIDTEGRHFHVLFQLQLFGLNGAFLTGDLFNLFVFFEILLLASYGLLLHGGGRNRVKAGLHYVVINLVGSTLFLFAVGTLYGVTGTLNMADLAVKLAQTPPENLALVQSAGLLLFAVFALKAALLPLYLWLPAAYAHTSAPVAALFAIMTKVGAYSILRVYSLMFGDAAGPVANLLDAWLAPLALVTLVLGMLGVLASTSLGSRPRIWWWPRSAPCCWPLASARSIRLRPACITCRTPPSAPPHCSCWPMRSAARAARLPTALNRARRCRAHAYWAGCFSSSPWPPPGCRRWPVSSASSCC